MEHTLRFSVDLGLGSLRGVLSLLADELRIEWRQFDIMDAPDGGLESTLIRYGALDRVSIKRRKILEVVAHGAHLFAAIPLPAGDLATLKARVLRQDRRHADGWVAEASLRIAEAQGS